jgi:energy-converting hydrogenase Eha subunit B
MFTTTQLQPQKILWATPLGGVVASVVNAILYIATQPFGAFPGKFVIRPGQPGGIPLAAIIIFCIGPALIATGVLWLLNRFTANPTRIFLIIAVVVFALEIIPPFTVPGIPVLTIVMLQIMHVVAAIAITWFGLYFSRKDEVLV